MQANFPQIARQPSLDIECLKIQLSLQFPKDLIRRKRKIKDLIRDLKEIVKSEFDEILEVNKIFYKEKKEVVQLGYTGHGEYKFPTKEIVEFINQRVSNMNLSLFLQEEFSESGDNMSMKGSYMGGDMDSHQVLIKKKDEFEQKDDQSSSRSSALQPKLNRNYSMANIVIPDSIQNLNKMGAYILEKIIDQGEYGTVYLGQSSKNRDLVAIKAIEPSKDIFENEPHKYYLKEKLAYELVGEHPYVVNMIDNYYMTPYNYEGRSSTIDAIILEYLPNGNLENLIEKAENQQHTSYGLDESSARIYFRQMLSGIKHIHSRGLCHRDIKLDNMVLNAQNECKIIDLTFVTDNALITNKIRIGSNQYMAPEIGRMDDYYGQIADMYSLGVCLFRLVTGGFPCLFRAGISDGIYLHIASLDYMSFWDEIDNYREDHGLRPLTKISETFKDLIQKMLCFEPNDRYTISQVEQHPWMLVKDEQDTPLTPTSAVQFKNKFKKKHLLTKTLSEKNPKPKNPLKQFKLPVFSPLLQIDPKTFLQQLENLKKEENNNLEKNKGPLYSLNKSY